VAGRAGGLISVFHGVLVVAAVSRGIPVGRAEAAVGRAPADGTAPGEACTSAEREEPGEGGALAGGAAPVCRVVSRLLNPVLANPGLANPAPVSSRARAAAASVEALSLSVPSDGAPSDVPPPGGVPLGDAAAAGRAGGWAISLSAAPAGPVPGFVAPAWLSLRGAPSGLGTGWGLVTAAGVKTLSGCAAPMGLPFPARPRSLPDPAGTLSPGTVWSEPLPSEPAALAAAEPAAGADACGREFASGSVFPLPDSGTAVSRLGVAPPGSSAPCAAGSSCLSTHPPVKSLATTLSAARRAGTPMALSSQS
jgi:hypothetical protein